MEVIAIDPGTTQSAYVVFDAGTAKIMEYGKVDNGRMLNVIYHSCVKKAVIEMVASYGMPVGREVFETCVWIGRFTEAANWAKADVSYIYRQEEKMALCRDSKAKDANIRRALIDRFAKHDLKRGTGTKKNPDWFYGFHDDIWAAYAVGVTWMDKQKEGAACASAT